MHFECRSSNNKENRDAKLDAIGCAVGIREGGAIPSQCTKDLGGGDTITWHLAGTGWQTGQFVNGDWWVVVPFGQTVTVTATTFGSTGTTPVPYTYTPNAAQVGASSLPLVRSGSMKNPRSLEAVTFSNIYDGAGVSNPPFGSGATHTGSSPTGYDSRSGWFHPGYVSVLPESLQAWDSLVTTISQPDAPNRPDYAPGSWTVRGTGWSSLFNGSGGDATSTTRLASVLTVLPEIPPGTVAGQSPCLRPPYGGSPANRAQVSGGVMSGSQPSSYLAPWSWDPALFLSRTPSVVRPANVNCPLASGVLDFWRGTFLDHLQHENCGTFLAPSDATPTYGRDQMAMIGTTALMLCETPSARMSAMERELLLAPFLQFGVDSYGMLDDGRRFNGSGGHSGGRKWPVLYAGIVMDNPFMRQEAGPHENAFGHRWKEDAQCLTLSNQFGLVGDWQGLLYRWRISEDVLTDYQDDAPSVGGWAYARCRDENYRVCCTLPAYIYFDLCCRLVANHQPAAVVAHAMEVWGNDAFFGCVDRFMLPMTPEACDEYTVEMEAIRQAEINARLSQTPPPPPGACDREAITGHYTLWGQPVGILFQSAYGEGMWRALRWANHQRGVAISAPSGFAGAQPYCQYGPQLDRWRCQTPAERLANPAPRALPTLITEQLSPAGATMWFEVHSVPLDSVISVYVAGNPVNAGFLNPGMSCACVSPPTSLCGAPLFVDYPTAPLTIVTTNYAYRNLNFSLQLPPAIGSFAIQAVMMPLDLSNLVSTNAYSITTY